MRPLAQYPLDFLDLPAHDGGGEILAHDGGILFQKAHRSMPCHSVRPGAADVMVRACVFQEAGGELHVGIPRTGALVRSLLGGELQILPVLQSVFARERVLDIPQHGIAGCLWIRAFETLPRFRIAFTQRLEPALCFFS